MVPKLVPKHSAESMARMACSHSRDNRRTTIARFPADVVADKEVKIVREQYKFSFAGY